MRIPNAGTTLLLAAMMLAGCTSSGSSIFGGPKQAQPVQALDPNMLPTNYRTQIAEYLTTQLSDRADYRNALISTPVLKPIGDSQRYVVCLQFNGRSEHKNKVVIYFAGELQQYLDSTPEQCGDAVFQPFRELGSLSPR
jgi:hypothetical protein